MSGGSHISLLPVMRSTLALCAVFLFPAWGAGAEAAPNSVKIGVLAKRGPEHCLEKWEPTAEYLSEKIPDYVFSVVPLTFDEVFPAVERREVDLILVNPALYVGLSHDYGVNRIATLKNLRLGTACTRFAGVIFCKAERTDVEDLRDLKGKDETVEEFAGEIILETERIATLTKNLLQFARHEKQSHSPARLCDIVEATLSLIRTVIRHDQITLEIDVPEDLPKIRCRSQQIQQVIMNLLTNARDALNEKYAGYHEDKVIEVTAALVEVGASAAGSSSHWIRLTVEDHGLGIPPEVQERMFDPFYTTKPHDKGTGLGLSISHGIVKDHGGELSVEAAPGQYTRFHVDLPADSG